MADILLRRGKFYFCDMPQFTTINTVADVLTNDQDQRYVPGVTSPKTYADIVDQTRLQMKNFSKEIKKPTVDQRIHGVPKVSINGKRYGPDDMAFAVLMCNYISTICASGEDQDFVDRYGDEAQLCGTPFRLCYT
jgi:hypothetical protein